MATNLLPDYVASAKPSSPESRAAWFKNTAPTYAGIMLWFAFWHQVPVGVGLDGAPGYSGIAGGMLAQGLGVALVAVVVAALVCHLLFYLVPGMLGMKTGLPLYVVGTSTYGVLGGFLMPGFLMGVLQFGWLGVNAFFASELLCKPLGAVPGDPLHAAICIVWSVAAAFMGLKGIQYVAKIATFLPLVPLVILIILTARTIHGVGNFDPKTIIAASKQGFVVDKSEKEQAAEKAAEKAAADKAAANPEATKAALAEQEAPAKDPVAEAKMLAAKASSAAGMSMPGAANAPTPGNLTQISATQKIMRSGPPADTTAIFLLICTYIVGFFATAGAAGADFGMNNRNAKDVQLGGLAGIAGATIFAGGLSLLIVAGAYGSGMVPLEGVASAPQTQTTSLMGYIVGSPTANVFWVLLAIAAFPPACFSSFIAANSFKTTLPKVNPFISVGIGTAAAIALAVSGKAGDAIGMFQVIGASFGPVCGAMVADYLLAGRKWAGPRAGFNPAGWISWIVGFAVGAADFFLKLCPATVHYVGVVPCPPVSAFIVGFLLYYLLAKIGLQSRVLEMPQAAKSA
jgi:purine-cytosine permease-like protein